MEENRPHGFTSVQVPVEIWFNKSLSPADKILLTEIVNLTKASKSCWKNNQSFADLLGVSKDRVTRLLSSLKCRGYIEVKMQYQPGTKQILRRTISVSASFRKVILGGLASTNMEPTGENADTLSVEIPRGIGENTDTPIGENTEENNTYKNKSINNTPLPPKGDDGFEKFWKLYNKKADKLKCERKWKNLSASDRSAIMAYLPSYVTATPDKQFRKNPYTFLNNRSWENELPAGSGNKAQTRRFEPLKNIENYGNL